MTETFIPVGAGGTAPPVGVPVRGESATPTRAVDTMVARDPNHSAQLALAQEVMGRASFTDLMQRGSALETKYRNLPSKLATEEEFNAVSELFAEAKAVYNEAEEARKTAIAFPDKYVRMTNKLIKETLKDPMDLVRKGSGRKRDDWIKEKEAERRAEDAAAVEVVETGVQGVLDASAATVPVGVIDIDALLPPLPPPPAPGAALKTDFGTVHQRETLTVEVEDPIALLKAIVSVGKRDAAFTPELVEFKAGALREMVKANTRRTVWPGLKVERVKKSV